MLGFEFCSIAEPLSGLHGAVTDVSRNIDGPAFMGVANTCSRCSCKDVCLKFLINNQLSAGGYGCSTWFQCLVINLGTHYK